MKKHYKLLIIPVLCAIGVGLPVLASAHADTDNTQNQTQKPTTTAKTEQEIQAEKQKLKERLEKQKADLKVKLNTAQEARIKVKCKASQGIIKAGEDHVKTHAPKREQAYQHLKEHMTKLLEKLKAKGVNTVPLEEQLVVLSGKIDTFKLNQAAYNQAISDAQNIDCAADPTGFKAMLESARSKRETLIQSASDIKNYVKNNIKPTLASIKSELESNKSNT